MKRNVRNEIIKSAARAAYVSSWANWAEEQGESLHGELMDQAPNTPAAAVKWARKLISTMEKMNGLKIDKMYWSAAQKADIHHSNTRRGRDASPEEFGYCTAMQSMGHGVSWGDDHPDHGFLIPHTEFYCHGEQECEGYVSDREGIASRG